MAKGKKIDRIEQGYPKAGKEYTQPLSKDNLTPEIFDALVDVADDTLPINKIIPDHTQPRRIIPYQFLDYVEDGYGAVIGAWEEYVFDCTDDFPTIEMLEGKKSVGDYVNDDPIVMAFGAMVAFAANIHDIGLNHPIGVVTRGDVYRIIYGERRWTAFQFLNHYLDGYGKIKARVANLSEWELAKMQASENSHRPELNAIAKARMFAKLLISARTEGGERYDSWKQLVVPNGCDRPYWAQVANGEIHRIPRGMGEQFVYAMNISVEQMRQYRNLLKLFSDHNLSHKVNDALWLLGDEGDWAERFLREIGQYLSADDVDEILNGTNGYTVTTVTVSRTEEALREAVESAKEAAELAKKQAERKASPLNPPATQGEDETPVDKSQWESFQWVGKEAWAGSQKVFVIDATRPQSAWVQYEKDGKVLEGEIHISALFEFAPGENPTLSSLNAERDSDNADNQKGDYQVGDRVKVLPNGKGTIRYIKDDKYGVFLDHSKSTHYYPATQLEPLDEKPADTGMTDKFGLPLMNGQTVKTRTGHTGKVQGTNSRYAFVDVNGRLSQHLPDTLEIVQPSSTDADVPLPVPTGETWQGLIVSTVVGAVAKVVEDNGDEVRIQFPPGHFAKQRKEYLTVLPESEWVAAVNRHIAQSGEQGVNRKGMYARTAKGLVFQIDDEVDGWLHFTQDGHKRSVHSKDLVWCGEQKPIDLEKSAYPDMVGKPLLWDGQPVFGVSKASETTMLVHLGNGDREEVPMAELVINEDAMKSPHNSQKNGTRQGLVFAVDDTVSKHLQAYSAMASTAENEQAVVAFEWLLGLTYERTNREQLDAAMNHAIDHIEDINRTVGEYVFEQFRLKLDELN